jgi:general secretion pathway protein D
LLSIASNQLKTTYPPGGGTPLRGHNPGHSAPFAGKDQGLTGGEASLREQQMKQPMHLRVPCRPRWRSAAALCCFALAAAGMATAQTAPSPDPGPQPPPQNTSATEAATTAPRVVETQPGKRQVRAAEDAYLAGARRLDHDDLSGAERDFARALQLDPENREYAIAISVAREHRLNELVQKSSKARRAGDEARADTLLAEARAIDPANQIVIEHSGPALLKSAVATQSPDAIPPQHGIGANGQSTPLLTDRTQLLSAGNTREPWKLQMPALAGPLRLRPTETMKSFHIRGDAHDVLRDVAAGYGIRAVFDDSVERKDLRFDLENVQYEQAMPILMNMSHVFAVPIDATSIMIAKDDSANRQRLERLLEETVFFPGFTVEQLNDMGQVMRNVFGVKATVQPGLQNIIVRASEDTLVPMNRTIEDLMEGTGEIMVEVKLYEVSTTHTRNIGATVPTQAGIYNVQQAAAALVNANQPLVQQGIAQGLISATASNFEIAGALIASGLVQSSLLSSTVGSFGNGTTLTGVTETGGVGFNLALNSTDSRSLDDVQMRVDDHQAATFRTGTKYPITTSTYTTGISTPASTLSGATINGVSVASLLSQFAGGSSATIPQVTYEDLGVTLKATPIIQKSGRINLSLDMKIEALAGGTLDGNPILESRQFTSGITVADGQTVMMVSYLTQTESAAVTGLPGLSELPGFQPPLDQDAEKDTGQLVVLITPHIVRKRSDMIAGPRILIRARDVAAN